MADIFLFSWWAFNSQAHCSLFNIYYLNSHNVSYTDFALFQQALRLCSGSSEHEQLALYAIIAFYHFYEYN